MGIDLPHLHYVRYLLLLCMYLRSARASWDFLSLKPQPLSLTRTPEGSQLRPWVEDEMKDLGQRSSIVTLDSLFKFSALCIFACKVPEHDTLSHKLLDRNTYFKLSGPLPKLNLI